MTEDAAGNAELMELDSALVRHLEIINSARLYCVQKNETKEKFLYTMAIPMFYSAWEGYFRITVSVCLRRICLSESTVAKHASKYITLWLQREQFTSDFYQSLIKNVNLGKGQKFLTKGRFDALTDFHQSFQGWLLKPLNKNIDFDKLVMTHSNVNPDVVQLNADIIGMDVSGVDFKPLHELLGRRNEIAHGGLLSLVSEDDCRRISDNTEKVMRDFYNAAVKWLYKINKC